MEIKTSTVKNVQGSGTHKDTYGIKYDFEIEMENGDIGQYSSKSEKQNKFEVGKQATYEWYGGKYPKMKPHYPKPDANLTQTRQKNDDVQVYIIRQNALGHSIEFNRMMIDYFKPDKPPRLEDIASDAEFFKDYVLNGTEKVTRIEAELPEDIPPHPGHDIDSLPF